MKKWKSWPCHDCGVQEGGFHEPGCDMERCPRCGGQLITCECSFLKKDLPPFRIPYLLNPVMCGLCGEQWPKFFQVADEEWKHFVVPALQDKVLCLECYEELKKLFPCGWKEGRVIEMGVAKSEK
jgi:hypothetical protein